MTGLTDRAGNPVRACTIEDPEAMFPHPSDVSGIQYAKQVCRRCEFRESCLSEALANRVEDGVWGGLTEREREALRRRRLRAKHRELRAQETAAQQAPTPAGVPRHTYAEQAELFGVAG